MEPLKNMYNRNLLQYIADVATDAIPHFRKEDFVKAVFSEGWEELELKQRIRRISTSLHSVLTGNYKADIKDILKLAKAIHKSVGRDNTFEYIFLPDFIEQYGTGHFSESLNAMEKITVLSSCEFAIRPFLIKDMSAVLPVMLQWTNHSHPSVRRLASEGCRPRLPWGLALPALKKDPSPVLPILEVLRNDPSEFVRRSVANNLNDIAKDNPQVVLSVAAHWQGHSAETDKILKHGCRTLLKKANPEALTIFGLVLSPPCTVSALCLRNKNIGIGDELNFSFDLLHHATTATRLRIEYIITYAKANGKQSSKVFRITENTYDAASTVSYSRKQSFADMTTRKHYAGAHRLAIAVNGQEMAALDFEVG